MFLGCIVPKLDVSEDQGTAGGRVGCMENGSAKRVSALCGRNGLGRPYIFNGARDEIEGHAEGHYDSDDRQCSPEAMGEISHGMISLVLLRLQS